MNKIKQSIIILVVFAGLNSVRAQFSVPMSTDWDGIVAKVITCKQTPHFLYTELELLHTKSNQQIANIDIDITKIVLKDVSTGDAYPVLHDDAGHYLAGPLSGESSQLIVEKLYPGKRIILWAFFAIMPTPSSPIDLAWPHIKAFNHVPIQVGKFEALGVFESPYDDLTINKLRMHRLRHVVQAQIQLSKQPSELDDIRWVYYQNMVLYDFKNQRLYSLMKNRENEYIAEPHTDTMEGRRFSLKDLIKNPTFFHLKYDPPPDWVDQVIVISPFIRPNRWVNMTGKSMIQKQGGTAVVGGPNLFAKAKTVLKAVEKEGAYHIRLSLDDIFAPDQYDVEPELPELQYLLVLIRGLPLKKVNIRTYSDNRGNPAFLTIISNKQAEALGKWLTDILKGYCAVSWEGFGPQDPIASNDTEDGRRANRRIEITLIK